MVYDNASCQWLVAASFVLYAQASCQPCGSDNSLMLAVGQHFVGVLEIQAVLVLHS